MSRVVVHARQPLDDGGDPGERPQLGGKAMHAGALPQRGVDARQLPAIEPRFASRPSGAFQRRAALRPPCVIPTMRRHPAHAEGTRYRRLGLAPGEQPRGLEPPRFQRSKIPTSSWHVTASQSTR